MSDIASVFPGGTGPLGHLNHAGPVSPTSRVAPSSTSQPTGALGPAPRTDRPSVAGDRVEVSDVARFMDLLRRLPSARLDRVESARLAIDQGKYETDEVIEQTITQLGDDLV